MTGTLLFVHGTGVRQRGYAGALEMVEAGLIANNLGDFRVVGCEWGSQIGDQFDDDWRSLVARTLPPEATDPVPQPTVPSDEETGTSAWDMLLRDPMMELRLVLMTSALPAATADGTESLATALRRIVEHPPEGGESGISRDELRNAARDIWTSDELTTDGYGTVSADSRGLIRVVAQAVVARALASRRFVSPGSEPRAAIDANARDDLVTHIERGLAPHSMATAAGNVIEQKLLRFLQNRGTNFVRERRRTLMQDYAAPFLADVAFYLRHGDRFREYVSAQLDDLEPPVIAVGHSLGGVILVDLLSLGRHDNVSLLVTAGTQAPLLYALRALEHLSPDDADSTPFTPWLNFYNPNDFLAFCIKPLFPELDGIHEEAIEPRGIPFPASHSAYWNQNRIYERMEELVRATPPKRSNLLDVVLNRILPG